MRTAHYCRLSGLDVAIALAILAAGMLCSALARTAEGQGNCCPPGTQCATQSVQGSVGMFGRATAWQDGSMTLRGGLGGATMRVDAAVASRNSSVVPVCVGSDPVPTAGVYIGVIAGHGVTLTAWHAAKHGVRSVGGGESLGIHFDKFGYDMAAVLSRPLDVPVAVLGSPAAIGQTVTIFGYPGGRPSKHSGRVTGYCQPESGQQWGDLQIGVASSDGDSGGAVVDANGQLVGLLWGTAANSSVAVSVGAIGDFLSRLQVILTAAEPAPAPLPLVPVQPPTPAPIPPTPAQPPTPDCEELRILIQKNVDAITALTALLKEPGPQGELALIRQDQASQKEAFDALDIKVGDVELIGQQARSAAELAKSQSDASKQATDELDREMKTLRLQIQRIETASLTATGTDASGKMRFRLYFDNAGNVTRIEPISK